MFNIYEVHGEAMTEEAKIRFIFKKINHEGLQSTLDAMKTKIATEVAGAVTYTTVVNHLATAVSELPDFLQRNRNVSGIQSGGGSGRGGGSRANFGPGPHHGIFNANNTVHTGHHPNWKLMSPDDKKLVNDERAKLGLGRNKHTKYPKHKSKADHVKSAHNQLMQLKAANTKHKRTIATLQTRVAADSPPSSDVEMGDAGSAFGGKSKKSKK
jgi:hypothetical protein